jgi:hypothetical protein
LKLERPFENPAGFAIMECKSSGLPGEWDAITAVFDFSVAAERHR